MEEEKWMGMATILRCYGGRWSSWTGSGRLSSPFGRAMAMVSEEAGTKTAPS